MSYFSTKRKNIICNSRFYDIIFSNINWNGIANTSGNNGNNNEAIEVETRQPPTFMATYYNLYKNPNYIFRIFKNEFTGVAFYSDTLTNSRQTVSVNFGGRARNVCYEYNIQGVINNSEPGLYINVLGQITQDTGVIDIPLPVGGPLPVLDNVLKPLMHF